jgi:hypothetical protein
LAVKCVMEGWIYLFAEVVIGNGLGCLFQLQYSCSFSIFNGYLHVSSPNFFGCCICQSLSCFSSLVTKRIYFLVFAGDNAYTRA